MFKRKYKDQRHTSTPLLCGGDRTVVKGFPSSMNAGVVARSPGNRGKTGGNCYFKSLKRLCMIRSRFGIRGFVATER